MLIIVFQRPKITAREISQQLGITERSVLAIVADLDDAGYITRTREGRTNTYTVNQGLPIPGPILTGIPQIKLIFLNMCPLGWLGL